LLDDSHGRSILAQNILFFLNKVLRESKSRLLRRYCLMLLMLLSGSNIGSEDKEEFYSSQASLPLFISFLDVFFCLCVYFCCNGFFSMKIRVWLE
jgi:hypothetical protein